MTEELKKNKDSKDRIEQIPEDARRLIFWLAMVILMAVVVYFWITSLPLVLTVSSKGQKQDETLDKINQELSTLLEKTQQELSGFEEKLNDLEATGTAPELNEQDLAELKEKIITKDWQTLSNKTYNFEIKVPPEWTINTSTVYLACNTTGQECIRLGPAGESQYQIKINEEIFLLINASDQTAKLILATFKPTK